jgi:hypothetical protein
MRPVLSLIQVMKKIGERARPEGYMVEGKVVFDNHDPIVVGLIGGFGVQRRFQRLEMGERERNGFLIMVFAILFSIPEISSEGPRISNFWIRSIDRIDPDKLGFRDKTRDSIPSGIHPAEKLESPGPITGSINPKRSSGPSL